MASIAIGDIHGNVTALNDLLTQIEPMLTSSDTLVFLGDYIDRGAQSRSVIDRILKLRHETIATIVTLKGNHEHWLLKTMSDHTCHSWLLATDAYPTIESYSPVAAETLRTAALKSPRDALYGGLLPLPYEVFFNGLPPAHVEFFQELQLFHQTADGIFVHAGVDVQTAYPEKSSPFTLLMGTFDFPGRYSGPSVVVYGHHDDAEMRDGWPHPRVTPWAVGIDTISHGVLTAVRLPDRTIFQSAMHPASVADS
jgi:serine/threonine protein phosphatase 1